MFKQRNNNWLYFIYSFVPDDVMEKGLTSEKSATWSRYFTRLVAGGSDINFVILEIIDIKINRFRFLSGRTVRNNIFRVYIS